VIVLPWLDRRLLRTRPVVQPELPAIVVPRAAAVAAERKAAVLGIALARHAHWSHYLDVLRPQPQPIARALANMLRQVELPREERGLHVAQRHILVGAAAHAIHHKHQHCGGAHAAAVFANNWLPRKRRVHLRRRQAANERAQRAAGLPAHAASASAADLAVATHGSDCAKLERRDVVPVQVGRRIASQPVTQPAPGCTPSKRMGCMARGGAHVQPQRRPRGYRAQRAAMRVWHAQLTQRACDRLPEHKVGSMAAPAVPLPLRNQQRACRACTARATNSVPCLMWPRSCMAPPCR